ncbi:MmcQ/YjbR family DNA-binding protein [Aerococcaceae bacterium zg-BR22]|uniref:MmcQ/YjbR family DNA-binding protein n=1 Tax=Aerococcaceae bacterium zg-1292 TaxID=2774330 RepID=UPI004064B005|nr:MmcQ/YjbR family DNA-binding protein [Aerococcaceae bacterium zg-BR22]
MFTKQLKLNDFDNEMWRAKGFEVSNKQARQIFQFNEAPQLQVQVTITQEGTTVDVKDLQFNDIWLPFYQQDNANAEWLKEALRHQMMEWSSKGQMTQEKIEALLSEHFPEAEIERPWEKSPNFSTFKTNGRWFALYTEVPGEKIGLDIKDNVSILNIKLPPAEIKERVDFHTYFPAYHMNKKHWLSIYLHEDTLSEPVLKAIEQSYQIVTKK